jgi:serine/threonine-protein kinase
MSGAYCDACGAKNRDEARFCKDCGQPMPEPDPSGETRTSAHAALGSLGERLARALAPDYRIERRLGRGGMGVVFLATEAALDRPVAVKVLPEGDDDPEAVARFLREARTAARLRHGNVVSIHAVGQRGGLTYFTMDHVDGETLSDRVRRVGPFAPPAAALAIAQVADGLAHAHAHGVVHRDLKPANVMIDRDDHVVVLDFGLAKRHDVTNLTVSGVVHGTPQFLSPEQAKGEAATPRSDLYSLGLTWHFLLTGEPLFTAETVSGVLAQHLDADPAPLVAAHPKVPPSVAPLLLRLIEKDPLRRVASAAEAAASLRRLAARLGATSGAHVEESPTVARGERRAPEPSPPAPSPAPPAPRPTRKGRLRERLGKLLDDLERKDD